MIALAFLLASILAGSLAANVWLTIKAIGEANDETKRADHEADIRVGQVATEAELTETQLRLEHSEKSLDASVKRVDQLEKIMAEVLNAPRNADLAPDDWRTRVLRLAAQTGPAEDGAGADAGAAVSQAGAAADPEADLRSAEGPDV